MGDPFKPKKSSLSAPSIGQKDNGIAQFLGIIASQRKGEDQSALQSQERGNIGQEIENVRKSLGRDFNPDEKVTINGVQATPNPKLDNAESKAVAGMSVYPGVKKSIMDLIKGGKDKDGVNQPPVFSSQKGLFGIGEGTMPNADRSVRQMAVQQSSPYATFYDKRLQDLQSKSKQLKQLMFDISGATLTDNEEAVLGNAFLFEGKSDEQIMADIESADDLMEAKAKVALGGANAAKTMIPGMTGNSPDPQGQQDPQNSGRIRVRNILSGKTGTISLNSFDPSKYEKV